MQKGIITPHRHSPTLFEVSIIGVFTAGEWHFLGGDAKSIEDWHPTPGEALSVVQDYYDNRAIHATERLTDLAKKLLKADGILLTKETE